MLLCAWKEKCLLLHPIQMRLLPHFVQVYIKTFFDLLDWRTPVWISAPGQIFYMWFFQAQLQAITNALSSSPHTGKLPFPHQICCTNSELQSLKGVAVEDSGTMAGHTHMHVCRPSSGIFVQGPLFSQALGGRSGGEPRRHFSWLYVSTQYFSTPSSSFSPSPVPTVSIQLQEAVCSVISQQRVTPISMPSTSSLPCELHHEGKWKEGRGGKVNIFSGLDFAYTRTVNYEKLNCYFHCWLVLNYYL